MADGEIGHTEETQSLGHYVRQQAKYGTAANTFSRTETVIRHTVAPDDTLQGIALKYAVSMEQIKRANRLWTNDSLFLHETLKIPVPIEQEELYLALRTNGVSPPVSAGPKISSSSSSSSEQLSHPLSADWVPETNGAGCSVTTDSNSSLSSSNQNISAESPVDGAVHEEPPEMTVFDFLQKIDCTTAQIRSQVEKMESDSSFHDPDLPKKQKKQKTARLLNSPRLGRTPDIQETDLCITCKPSPKHVRSSLRKVAQDGNDDIFEL